MRFTFSARVDVRTFREDNSFVVDVETNERRNARPDGSVRSDELSEMAAELAERANERGKAAPKGSAPKSAGKGAAAPPPAQPPQQPQPQSQTQPPAQQTPAQQQAAAPPPPPAQAAPPAQPAATPPSEASPQQQQAAAPPPAATEPPSTAPVSRAQPPPVRPPQQTPAATPPRETVVQETPPPAGGSAIRAVLKRNGDNLSITFPFAAPTPAAVFRRADTVWMVFDTEATVGISALNADQGKAIRSASAKRLRDIALVRVKLERPQLISVAADGNSWVVTLGNEVVEPTRPLLISRHIVPSVRSTVTIAIDEPRNLHRIEDPDAGDLLYVITAMAPARGFLKSQDFVEFRALASSHGIALQPLADDLTADLSGDKIVVSRPAGLSLSAVARTGTQELYQRHVLDRAVLGVRPAGQFQPAQDGPHPCRRGRAGTQAPAGALRPRALLPRPRHVRRGEGGARRRAGGQSAHGRGSRPRSCCAPSPIS